MYSFEFTTGVYGVHGIIMYNVHAGGHSDRGPLSYYTGYYVSISRFFMTILTLNVVHIVIFNSHTLCCIFSLS